MLCFRGSRGEGNGQELALAAASGFDGIPQEALVFLGVLFFIVFSSFFSGNRRSSLPPLPDLQPHIAGCGKRLRCLHRSGIGFYLGSASRCPVAINGFRPIAAFCLP